VGPLRTIALGVALGVLLGACAVNQRAAPSRIETITADEAIAITSKVVDCEWQAVGRFDDGRTPIAQLAERIMGVCTVERIKAKRAFGLSPNDPDLESDDFKQAVEIVESARKQNAKKP
jgi:hypothetical protein